MVNHVDIGLHIVVGINEGPVRDGLTVQADAFANVQQVRRRETARAQAQRSQQSIHHACSCRFAVRARDMHARVRRVGIAQNIHHAPHALQAGLDFVFRGARHN